MDLFLILFLVQHEGNENIPLKHPTAWNFAGWRAARGVPMSGSSPTKK